MAHVHTDPEHAYVVHVRSQNSMQQHAYNNIIICVCIWMHLQLHAHACPPWHVRSCMHACLCAHAACVNACDKTRKWNAALR